MSNIIYKNEIIEYEINKGKRKNCYIVIEEGKVLVKVPKYLKNKDIIKLVESKKEWIYINLKKQKESRITYKNNDIIKVLGEDYKLQIIHSNIIHKPEVLAQNNILYLYLPENVIEKESVIKTEIEKYYFKISESIINPIMQEVTTKVGIAPNSYKIKRLKRTWGNCSSTKNISLNVNLMKYSKHAIEYVILHEICHLKYMNHSKEFWNMVKTYMSDYKMAKEELKY